MIRSILSAFALIILGACAQDVAAPNAPDVARLQQVAPPGAEPGTCWGKDVTPAIIETQTQQVLLQPARIGADGKITAQAVYKTETQQEIVRERDETWFRAPCDAVMTIQFVSSLQRALAARNIYKGPINGELDNRTAKAIRRYQKPKGVNSATLSIAAARELGLLAVDRDTKD